MSYSNKTPIILVGNVGNIKYGRSQTTGQTFVRFGLAVNNEERTETKWYTCYGFGGIVEMFQSGNIRKGDFVSISGVYKVIDQKDENGNVTGQIHTVSVNTVRCLGNAKPKAESNGTPEAQVNC